jgi:hypothetical protein
VVILQTAAMTTEMTMKEVLRIVGEDQDSIHPGVLDEMSLPPQEADETLHSLLQVRLMEVKMGVEEVEVTEAMGELTKDFLI